MPVMSAMVGLSALVIAASVAAGQSADAPSWGFDEALRQPDASAAATQYRAIVEDRITGPRDKALLRLAQHSYTAGDYAAALELLERINEPQRMPECLRWEALALFASGRYEDAARVWQGLSETTAEPAVRLEARAGYADCLWHLGRRERAAEEYLQLSESGEDWALPSWPLYRLAKYHLVEGRSEVAWELYRMLADRFPMSPEAAMARGALADVGDEVAGGPFTVQVGAFSQPGNAEGLQRSLRESGYDARVVAVLVGETHLSTVRVGVFRREADAIELREKLRREMGLEGRVVEE